MQSICERKSLLNLCNRSSKTHKDLLFHQAVSEYSWAISWVFLRALNLSSQRISGECGWSVTRHASDGDGRGPSRIQENLPSKKYSENQQKQQLQINDHASLSTKQRSHSPNSLLSFQFHHKVWQATVSLRLLEKS
ncbi:hypothetical protein SCA6_017293 [Theobroma cacao]